jgi:hypothetical protein
MHAAGRVFWKGTGVMDTLGIAEFYVFIYFSSVE